MKLIKCIVRPDKVDEVVEALKGAVTGLTVSEGRGHGRQKGQPFVYRGVEYGVTLLHKSVVEIVCYDNIVDDVVRIVTESAKTGNIGDGRIFVMPVEEAYRVRSGFMDLD